MTNLEITNAYVGDTQVEKIYLGTDIVWGGGEPGPDYSKMPLTFNIISAGTIVWKANSSAYIATISYSKDDGLSWSPITSNTGDSAPSISVSAGDKVQFRGDNATYYSGSTFNTFSGSTANFEVEGNIMSLIDSTNFVTATTLTSSHTFNQLFRDCAGLTSAERLKLPASTLAPSCYRHMFWNCTSLTAAPELPATTLADYCYYTMFHGCTSLTTAPALPATTLASTCYQGMFSACTSLTTAPVLPATSLTTSCYLSMFRGCTSLTTAPEILATDYGTTNSCRYMFQNCTNLNYIKCMFNPAPGGGTTSPMQNWVQGVASTGTFVKDPNASGWQTGTSGIPEGWTVQDA